MFEVALRLLDHFAVWFIKRRVIAVLYVWSHMFAETVRLYTMARQQPDPAVRIKPCGLMIHREVSADGVENQLAIRGVWCRVGLSGLADVPHRLATRAKRAFAPLPVRIRHRRW